MNLKIGSTKYECVLCAAPYMLSSAHENMNGSREWSLFCIKCNTKLHIACGDSVTEENALSSIAKAHEVMGYLIAKEGYSKDDIVKAYELVDAINDKISLCGDWFTDF